MALFKLVSWREGPITGVAQALAGGKFLVALSDGTVWQCQIVDRLRGSGMPLLARVKHESGVEAMRTELRLLFKWAKKTAVDDGTVRSMNAPEVVSAKALPYALAELASLGAVKYLGFALVAKRSAHSLEQLHRCISDAVLACSKAWDWEPRGLLVQFHDHERFFGLAYSPGHAETLGERRISLNVRLLEGYDVFSVGRVVLHELCHHFREERWPRQWNRWTKSHDEKFCGALVLVDPVLAKDPARCEFFADQMDSQLAEKVLARKVSAQGGSVVWAPNAGGLLFRRLKSGEFRLDWYPRPGFRWKPVVMPLNRQALLGLLERFSPSDWSKVEVELDEASMGHTLFAKQNVRTLRAFVEVATRVWPTHMGSVEAYVAEAEGRTAPE